MVRLDRDIHKHIQWRRYFGRLQSQRLHRREHVIRTIVVVLLDPQELVAIFVARGNLRVVDSPRGILNERQNGTTLVRAQDISYLGSDAVDVWTGVFEGHEFLEVGRTEGPKVDHLVAVGVDDFDGLASFDVCR